MHHPTNFEFFLKETKKKELNSYKKIASRLSAITLRSVPTGNKAILPNAYLSS